MVTLKDIKVETLKIITLYNILLNLKNIFHGTNAQSLRNCLYYHLMHIYIYIYKKIHYYINRDSIFW